MSAAAAVPRSVLAVVAHPDDLEMMAGGAVARWTHSGAAVHCITLTDGVWITPDGRTMRDAHTAEREARAAAGILGHTVEHLGRPAMDLRFEDALVREVLARVERLRPDTILCPWDRDLHHDHEVAARVAIAASRRIPRVLMGQINPYLNEVFTPNLFVDIATMWERKLAALACYVSEWQRARGQWEPFIDDATRHYGHMVGVARAEGFVSRKFLL
ncbi:MAG: PIG-L deacetylase family protein [Planctomycetaceae bacterium]